MQVDEMMEKIYGVYMLDEEFIVDMSSGDIGSVFLTSKGRVITSGDGFLRNGVKTHKQDDSIINELNLKVLERTENRFLRREKIKLSPFRVKQVAMTREHLLILTARGLVWKMDSSNIWILQKFFKTENNTSFSNIAKIKYIQASDIWFIALCEHNEVYAAWLRRRKNSGTANYVIAGASLKPIFQMEEGDSVQDVYISSFRAAIVTTFGNVFLGPCHRLVRCPITERVIKVALNFPHTLCLTENGNCYGFGISIYGTLGGLHIDENQPTLLACPNSVKDIHVFAFCSVIQTIDNEFWAIGNNSFGELAIATQEEKFVKQFTKVTLPKIPCCAGDALVWRRKQNFSDLTFCFD